jgi:hypothetical protein
VNRLFSALGVLFIGLLLDETVRRLFQSRAAMRAEYRQRYRRQHRRWTGNRELKKEQVMLDLIYIVIVLAFFAMAAAYTRGCARL